MKCALCNRPLEVATVKIGLLPVGPKCAKRAGLIELARKRQGAVRLFQSSAVKRENQKTLPLWEEE